MIELYIVFPIIKTDFIKGAVESLYKYTDKDKFRVVVVDQSIEGLDKEWIDKYIHLYIRQKNSGFARASNQGIIHALRDNIPYIAVCNDDVRFIYDKWWEDLLEEFKTDPKIVAVCPECPKVPGWGYGLNGGEYIDILPYKEEYISEDIVYLKQGDYNKEEITNRHPFVIPDSFPFTNRGVVDGFAMWLPVFKREALIELGLFDEKFIWGSGEDYDMLARAYSCAWPIDRKNCEEKYHRRMVSTMKSWVYHFWSQSVGAEAHQKLDPKLFEGLESWNNAAELWPPEINDDKHYDPWAHKTDDNGVRTPFHRIKEVGVQKLR